MRKDWDFKTQKMQKLVLERFGVIVSIRKKLKYYTIEFEFSPYVPIPKLSIIAFLHGFMYRKPSYLGYIKEM